MASQAMTPPRTSKTGHKLLAWPFLIWIVLPLPNALGQTASLWMEVPSPYQPAGVGIQILMPETHSATKRARLPVVFVLPVEAHRESRWGDPIKQLLGAKLVERFPAIYVVPTFGQLPWYGDHPTQPTTRQESHFIKAVVPLVDKALPSLGTRESRYLIGFSKSGFGAWSLFLRHPDLFHKAVAWDAPLTVETSQRYGMRTVFPTDQDLAPYRITHSVASRPRAVRPGELLLCGYGNFRQQHRSMHLWLLQHGISHDYRDGPARRHHWDSGWLTEAIQWCLEDR